MKKLILVTILTSLLSACANQSYIIEDTPIDYTTDTYTTTTQDFYLWGLGQEEFLNSNNKCSKENGRIVRVDTYEGIESAFLGWLTAGIYAPRDVTVYCKYKGV
jgi:hypothetical protein|tara:strand:- start:668 stop:979 length:312 start_codon:yes stop_codon:yes gene_type:complete